MGLPAGAQMIALPMAAHGQSDHQHAQIADSDSREIETSRPEALNAADDKNVQRGFRRDEFRRKGVDMSVIHRQVAEMVLNSSSPSRKIKQRERHGKLDQETTVFA